MKLKTAAAAAALLTLSVQPLWADEVTDTLQNAIAAYEDGDMQYAFEELAFAQQLLQEKRLEQFRSFLPPVPAGWSEVQNNYNQGGGMVMVNVTYRGQAGQIMVTISLDNPQMAQVSQMLSNPAQLSGNRKMVRIGRYKFIEQPNQMMGVVGGRIFVQANGNDMNVLRAAIDGMDLRGLAGLVN